MHLLAAGKGKSRIVLLMMLVLIPL